MNVENPRVKLSVIQNTLAELGLRPTRSLGQNFLHDQNLADWIVQQIDLQPNDAWVEIGPGLGALTEFALKRSPRGTLVEKDDRLIPYLRNRFADLQIRHTDAAQIDIRDFFPLGPTKVMGNLPYYVSSQILFNFTSEPNPFTGMVFTLQKELAERLCAPPGTGEYGALTLLIGQRWKVKYARTLPASVFTPAPQVESAVVVLTPRDPDELPPCDIVRFTKLVKLGFSQRRKQLRKLLAAELPECGEVLVSLGLTETARAEELSLEQWRKLAGGADAASVEELAGLAQDIHKELFDVVDEQDRPVAVAPRGRVHAEKLRHRAIHIFVFNRRGELFLQRRSRWKDAHPRRWDSSAAGHVNAGQDYRETAERELVEELGVSAEVVEIGSVAACPGTGWEFVRIYRAEHEGPFILPPAEIEGGGWFTPEQIDRWIAARPEDFATGFLECWKAVPVRR
jgi:16S rRNA (adenine1518-N6/adenine1519-N6)-dimethyltransferase